LLSNAFFRPSAIWKRVNCACIWCASGSSITSTGSDFDEVAVDIMAAVIGLDGCGEELRESDEKRAVKKGGL
jgi:hypothetical protein